MDTWTLHCVDDTSMSGCHYIVDSLSHGFYGFLGRDTPALLEGLHWHGVAWLVLEYDSHPTGVCAPAVQHLNRIGPYECLYLQSPRLQICLCFDSSPGPKVPPNPYTHFLSYDESKKIESVQVVHRLDHLSRLVHTKLCMNNCASLFFLYPTFLWVSKWLRERMQPKSNDACKAFWV